jgi:hypothetical protein
MSSPSPNPLAIIDIATLGIILLAAIIACLRCMMSIKSPPAPNEEPILEQPNEA